jgi:excisionase family DNA binding protein
LKYEGYLSVQGPTCSRRALVDMPFLGGYETTKEVAARLGLNDSRVRQLILEGRLEAEKIGRIWFVPRDARPRPASSERARRRTEQSLSSQVS